MACLAGLATKAVAWLQLDFEPGATITLAHAGPQCSDAAMPSNAERLCSAFAEACKEQEVLATLSGGPEQLQLRFEPQEGASGELIESAFLEEMGKTGVAFASIVEPAKLDEQAVVAAEQALRTAIGRIRILMIEFNSYISGGLDWVFPNSPDALSERGLAKYRFPARGEVDIVAESDHVCITMHGGDLGNVTSSGFYVPTRVRGDYEATIRYELGDWQPGGDSVSVALFAQDEPSQLRYYAQRRTAGQQPHEVLANFNNDVLTDAVAVSAREGSFRVARRGDLVTCSHCEGGVWTLLGEHRGDAVNDMIFGSKIWSSGRAGPFVARLYELTVVGELPPEQIAPLPIRPDPRFSD